MEAIAALTILATSAFGFINYIQYASKKPECEIFRSEETKKELEEAIEKNKISKKYFNYAFIGHLKAGKSTLINALRGLQFNEKSIRKSDDVAKPHNSKGDVVEPHNPKGPAKTGRLHIENFQFYEFDEPGFFVRFYDVPGSGNMTIEKYFTEYGLIAFDCLLILCQQTPCAEEFELAKVARLKKIPFCFVRSKCDSDLIEPIIRACDGDFDEAAAEAKKLTQDDADEKVTTFKKAFEDMKKNLNETSEEYFCISSSVLVGKMLEHKKKLKEAQGVKEIGAVKDPKKFNFHFEEEELLEYVVAASKKYRYNLNEID